jgi:hypothetical protein
MLILNDDVDFGVSSRHQVCEYNAKDEYPSSDKRSNPADNIAHIPACVSRDNHRLFVKSANSQHSVSVNFYSSGNIYVHSDRYANSHRHAIGLPYSARPRGARSA